MIGDIWEDLPMPRITVVCNATQVIVFMITRDHHHLAVILRCPPPEFHARHFLVSQVGAVTCQDQNITDSLERNIMTEQT